MPKKRKLLEAVILAAGKGSRLSPLTEFVPKSLLCLPGGSLFDFHLRALRSSGISRIFVVCGHLEDEMRVVVEKKYPECEIIRQTGEIGTAADGLLAVEQSIKDDFLVIHGDHFFATNPFEDLISAHVLGNITFLVQDPKADSVGYGNRCVYYPDTRTVQYGNGNIDHACEEAREMTLVDGCTVLPKGIFGLIRELQASGDRPEMHSVFGSIAERNVAEMKGVIFEEFWANINDFKALAKTVRYIYMQVD